MKLSFLLISTFLKPVLQLVRCIKEIHRCTTIIEDFPRTEESFQLNGCVLHRVRCVNNVLLITHGVIATDGSRIGRTTIGKTRHGSYDLNSFYAADCHGHNGRCHHGGCQRREEGTVNKVRIMLAENGFVQLHHFHTCDAEASTLKTVNYFANQLTLNATGFEQNECCFHI